MADRDRAAIHKMRVLLREASWELERLQSGNPKAARIREYLSPKPLDATTPKAPPPKRPKRDDRHPSGLSKEAVRAARKMAAGQVFGVDAGRKPPQRVLDELDEAGMVVQQQQGHHDAPTAHPLNMDRFRARAAELGLLA